MTNICSFYFLQRTTIHGRDVGKSPVLVHCSAGVGRTGTYIAIDRFLDGCADLYSKETILDIVNSLREARNYMVQSQIQFNYLHSAIFDGVAALLMRVQRVGRLLLVKSSEDLLSPPYKPIRNGISEGLTPISVEMKSCTSWRQKL